MRGLGRGEWGGGFSRSGVGGAAARLVLHLRGDVEGEVGSRAPGAPGDVAEEGLCRTGNGNKQHV